MKTFKPFRNYVSRIFPVLLCLLACLLASPTKYQWSGNVSAQQTDGADDIKLKALQRDGLTACTAPVSINPGQSINGILQNGDCLLSDNSYYDAYSFTGTAGQQIYISLSSTQFNSYLFLYRGSFPGGEFVADDNDGGGSRNARIPAGAGFLTLPASGTYTILANSLSAAETGSYTLFLGVSAAQPCSYIVNFGPVVPELPASGGFRTFDILTQSNCPWTAFSNVSWITVFPASGSGSATVTISVSQNFGASRIGSVVIAGQTLNIFQQDVSTTCTYSVTRRGAGANEIPSGGGSVIYDVTTQNGCSWTSASSFPWITVSAGSSGTGNGSVTVNVASNSGPIRTGTVIIAGQTITITQNAAPACSYSVAQIGTTIPEIFASGATRSFSVTTQAGCPWTVVSNVPWITFTTANGIGSGTFTVTIAPNTGPERSGTINIMGQVINFFQLGATCTYSISPSGFQASVNGGAGSFNITAPAGCAWIAASNIAWINITGGNSGVGSGTISFNILPNSTGSGRVGAITVAGQTYVITQAGGATPRRTVIDFDGDGKTDYAVAGFARGFSTMQLRYWYISINGTNEYREIQFGMLGDREVPADYDGDGKTDIAVFRGGVWYWLQSSDNTFHGIQWGLGSDIPVPADYDGDRKADLAVFRQGNWYFLNSSNNQFLGIQWGLPLDKPVPADYDGDGKTDVAVYRNGSWYWLQSSNNAFGAAFWGLPSDSPVVADYDGDGKANPAVYRNGIWYIYFSPQSYKQFQLGNANDKLTVGDYDGDGKADISVWTPQTALFSVLRSSDNQLSQFQFGQFGDVPLASAYFP